MRSDARLNRERILLAAREAFASDGPEVPIDAVAKLAGVGPGTVHRHFPTKAGLLAAVVADSLSRLAERAREMAGAADATDAFFAFLRELTVEARDNAVLTEALGDDGIGAAGAAAAGELTSAVIALLVRAQQAGGVKSDLTVPDVHAILSGVIAMERRLPVDRRGLGLDVVIDGMRSP